VKAAIRRSPAARLSARRGAVFVEEAGWEIPASYGGDAAERAAIRDRVAIADITARAKVDLRGELPELLPVPPGAVAARISREWAVVLGVPDADAGLLRAMEPLAGARTIVTDATHLFAGFALAGPGIADVIERATSWDLATLAPGEATGAPIVEIPALMARRDLVAPVLEAYVGTEYGRYAWETLSALVVGLGGEPVGWQALRAEGWR
jgi:glycine cleavage system aminomethyltransferase T